MNDDEDVAKFIIRSILGIISLIIFIILKCTGSLDISWWWSMAALLSPISFWLGIALINEFID